MADLASKMELRELEDEKRRNLRADRERAILESGIDADIDLRGLQEGKSDALPRSQDQGSKSQEDLNMAQSSGQANINDGINKVMSNSSSQAEKTQEKIHTTPPAEMDYASRMVKMKKELQGAGILPADEVQQPKTLKDQFLEALAFFAPTIGGALIGGAFEGSAGGVAGAKAGTDLNQAWLKFQGENADRAAKKDPYKQFEALKQAQSEEDDHAKEVAVERRFQAQLGLRERGLDVAEGNLTERQAKTVLEKAKAGQLSDKQVEGIKNTSKLIKNTDSLIGMANDPYIKGKIGAFGKGSVNTFINQYKSDPKLTRFLSELNVANAQQIHELYGSVLAKNEEYRANKFLPSESDTPANLIQKLKSLRDLAEREQSTFIETIEKAQPLKKDVLKSFQGKGRKEGETWEDSGFMYRMKDGKIQKKAK